MPSTINAPIPFEKGYHLKAGKHLRKGCQHNLVVLPLGTDNVIRGRWRCLDCGQPLSETGIEDYEEVVVIAKRSGTHFAKPLGQYRPH
jgi:hypothetical protein